MSLNAGNVRIRKVNGNIDPEDDLDPERDDDENEDDESDDEVSSESSSKFKKLVTVMMVSVVAVIGVVALLYFMQDKDDTELTEQNTVINNPPPQVNNDGAGVIDPDRPWLNNPGTETEVSTEINNAELPSSENIPNSVTGIKDISGNTVTKNNAPVDKDTFVKDLTGADIKVNYDIASISTTIDFVSYVKKRASTDEGIELYWLEATYKGKKAKIQVPLSIFKELDPEGVTVVDVEVTKVYVGDNNDIKEIATGFTVRPDYQQLLLDRVR